MQRCSERVLLGAWDTVQVVPIVCIKVVPIVCSTGSQSGEGPQVRPSAPLFNVMPLHPPLNLLSAYPGHSLRTFQNAVAGTMSIAPAEALLLLPAAYVRLLLVRRLQTCPRQASADAAGRCLRQLQRDGEMTPRCSSCRRRMRRIVESLPLF